MNIDTNSDIVITLREAVEDQCAVSVGLVWEQGIVSIPVHLWSTSAFSSQTRRFSLELAGPLPAPGQHGSQETYQVLAGLKFHSKLYVGLQLQQYVQSDWICLSSAVRHTAPSPHPYQNHKVYRLSSILIFLPRTHLRSSSLLINVSKMKLSKLHYNLTTT